MMQRGIVPLHAACIHHRGKLYNIVSGFLCNYYGGNTNTCACVMCHVTDHFVGQVCTLHHLRDLTWGNSLSGRGEEPVYEPVK